MEQQTHVLLSWKAAQPKVLENAEGRKNYSFCSCILLKMNEKLIGQPAKRQAVTNPENTIFAVKRLIGRNFDDSTVKKDIEAAPFKIVNSEKGDAWIESQRRKIFSFTNLSIYSSKNERNC